MVSRTDTAASTDRRSFLAAAGATVAGGLLATGGADAARQASFHLTQGQKCIPLRPLRGDDPVKAFYDYRTDRYSSYGTRSLQESNTSILFLYEGPDGVSLVFVHGKLGGSGDGGSVTFDISDLPSSGTWLIEDDSYEGSNRYDRWKVGKTTATIDWTWDSRRADGGVFGYLDDHADIEIDPAFNHDAALFGDHYDGTVTAWQALSGDRSDPTRTSLDQSAPVRIQSGACPSPATSNAKSESTSTETPTRTPTSQPTHTNSTSPAHPTRTQSPTASGASTPKGIGGELQGLLDEFSRMLDQASRFLDRMKRFVDQLSRSVQRYL